jgi:hypothetical protein
MNRKRVRDLKVIYEEHAMKRVDEEDRLQICQRWYSLAECVVLYRPESNQLGERGSRHNQAHELSAKCESLHGVCRLE